MQESNRKDKFNLDKITKVEQNLNNVSFFISNSRSQNVFNEDL